ncbi:Actin-related protein 2/3 complex subunit 5 [Tylopilus felleus]
MSFRKIDVDQYDEDVLQETELYDPDPRDPAQVLSDTKQKQLAVRSALNKCVVFSPSWVGKGSDVRMRVWCHRRSDITGALNVVLDTPPYGPNVEDAKNLALQIVVSVLNSTKSTDVSTVLRSLSQDEHDTLMKYIYKGMGMPGWGDVSGSVLLGWHEKIARLCSPVVACVVSLPIGPASACGPRAR